MGRSLHRGKENSPYRRYQSLFFFNENVRYEKILLSYSYQCVKKKERCTLSIGTVFAKQYRYGAFLPIVSLLEGLNEDTGRE
jgi:hypothetical protein